MAVDIFAGAGGLTLGAQRAGFDVRVAVELDADACATYRKNHPTTILLESDAREVSGSKLLPFLQGARPDLLMGCAPCQGFCSLNMRSDCDDPRDRLIDEMARLVEETLPATVLMENVPGLALRGRCLLDGFLGRLHDAGYLTQWWNVQMADYGVPQRRRRLVLLAGRGFSIDLPEPTHARAPSGADARLEWRTLRDAISAEPPAQRLSVIRKNGGPRKANWHVVRDLMPETRKRLIAAKPGAMRVELDDKLLPDCHRDGYTGFRNVYMRMRWDAPAPTITAGCTTPAKGRFGHPDPARTTISVREAAMLQTFPEGYRIETDKIDKACELVGNAVPPQFAETLTRHVGVTIREHRAKMARAS